MKHIVIDTMAAAFVFLAIVMIVAAAGMMDNGAEINVCVKLVFGSILAFVAGAGFAGWRRI